jgi:colanic acid/amylovoran biosynthesis glycosyltransferase
MNNKIAVVAPYIGASSETFVQRHMQNLLPGQTVVIASSADMPYAGHWSVDCPVLILNQASIHSLHRKALRLIYRSIGIQPKNCGSTIHDDAEDIIINFLNKHNVKMILGEYLSHSFPFFPIAQKMGIKYFAHAHGEDISAHIRLPNWQTKYSEYKQAEGIITINQISYDRLVQLGISPSKIHIVPCGTDVPDLPRQRTQSEVVRCLAVGRMVPKKAPILLLDAFRRAVEVDPNLHLDYIGAGDLGPSVSQFIQAFNLHEKVTLHGSQPSQIVQEFMARADIFLQHSMTDPDTGDEEGLPVAILEAMGHALPVVSTLHTGIPEAVINAETGLLTTEGDSATMAKNILLLSQNGDLRIKMGLAGWQRAKQYFTWQHERDKILKIMGLDSSPI